MDEIIRNIAVYALPVLFAITLSEAAHGFAAKFFGDNTAFAAGRMTLNPAKHIDPIGTILVPMIMVVIGSGFMFGWARPVPLDPRNLRHPRRDMAWIALSGPLANFLMALAWLLLALTCKAFDIQEAFPFKVAQAGVQFNLMLFAFLLLPVPPLAGGKVVVGILPARPAERFARIEPYGFYIVLGLILFNVAGYWVQPVGSLAAAVILLLTSPFT
jgi:Zn-dependent protease